MQKIYKDFLISVLRNADEYIPDPRLTVRIACSGLDKFTEIGAASLMAATVRGGDLLSTDPPHSSSNRNDDK